MIEPTEEMIYAFAGEPEITATDAHAIRVGLAAVLAIVERDRAEEAAAVAEVVQAYRASVAKGYFRSPRGAVARAVDRLSKAVGP